MEIKEKINFKRLNSVIKKNKIILILCIIIFIVLGCIYSYYIVTPKYKSTSTIVLTNDNNKGKTTSVTQTDVNLNTKLVSTYGNILKSNSVLERVIEDLNLDISIEELNKDIKINEIDDTQIIEVSILNKDAAKAQEIGNELNKIFIEEVKKIYNLENVNILDNASLNQEPYNINHVRDICVFGIIGIVCSSIIIMLIYFLDTTIKIEQDIEEYTDLNLIGVVPKVKIKEELIVKNNDKSSISEAIKVIRTNLLYTNKNGESKAILFTSCNPGEGKSWIVSNLAITYAQTNKNVLIIDSDMRKGRQHKIFNVEQQKGLSDLIAQIDENNLDENYKLLPEYIKESKIPKLHIITIGSIPPNPSELLSSKKMNVLINMLKNVYDIIILDGTPCNLVSDSIPISRIVDNTVIVAESRSTKIEELNKNVKLIKNIGGNVTGAILNKKEYKKSEYKNGYYGELTGNSKEVLINNISVKELIRNRKIEKETENNNSEEIIDKEKINDKLNNIEKLINNLPKNTSDSNNILEELKSIYEKEIERSKYAEKINYKLIRKELIEKLQNENIDIKNILNEKVNQITGTEDIILIKEKLNDIENTIKNISIEENIIEKLEEVGKVHSNKMEELNKMQNEKMEELNKIQNNKIEKLKEEQSKKIDEINAKENIKNIEDEINKLNEKYEKINNIESLIENSETEENIMEKLENVGKAHSEKMEKLSQMQNEKMEELNKIQNNKIEELKQIQNEKIEQLKEEQSEKIEQINTKENIQNIEKEINKLNEKYEKINNIENLIENSETEENIIEKLDELGKTQNGKIEELNQIQNEKMEELKAEQSNNIKEINSKEEIKEIVDKIDYLNSKYDRINKIEEMINNSTLKEELYQYIDKISNKQEQSINKLDNSLILNNLVIEMQKLNRKYEKVEAIEQLINKKEAEKINNEKQIENSMVLNNLVIQIQKLNDKYNELLNKIDIKESKKHGKIIELNKIKERIQKQKDLIINIGDTIEYEQLLNNAVEIIDLNNVKKIKKA